MAIILFFISILLIFLLLLSYKEIDISKSIIGTLLISSLLVTLSSEVLSLFHSFNYNSLTSFWLLTSIIGIILLVKKKSESNQIEEKKQLFINSVKNNKFLFTIISLILFLIGFQGLIYPPNNFDSLTYHMGRIPHWIANESIQSYAGHIYRQINSPPLSELCIAQLGILYKSDLFSNSVQYFFLIGCLACFISISQEFNFSKNAKIIGLLFLIGTPDIILQGSSTQNDIVVSFFILSTCLFAIKSFKYQSLLSLSLLAISAGLALYTKGTAYIFLFPILIIWGTLFILKYKSNFPFFKIIVIPFFIILINLGFYTRNYSLSGDPLGKNEDRVFNEAFGLNELLLNTTKNIGVHFAIYPLNQFTNQVVEKIHLTLKEDIRNSSINFNGHKFKLKEWQHNEDDAANIFQIILILICIFLYIPFRKKNPSLAILLLLIPILELLFFSFTLKWQPWITRLQLPIIFLFSFYVAFIISQFTNAKEKLMPFIKIIFGSIIFYAVIIIFLNPTRPFVTSSFTNDIKITDTRFKKYFALYTKCEPDFYVSRKYLTEYEGKIGIDIGGDTWEYPLYYDIFSKNQQLAKPLNILNLSKKLDANNYKDLKIIISYKKDSIYSYNNTKFYPIKKMELFTIYRK
jgi:hypothetical protein